MEWFGYFFCWWCNLIFGLKVDEKRSYELYFLNNNLGGCVVN